MLFSRRPGKLQILPDLSCNHNLIVRHLCGLRRRQGEVTEFNIATVTKLEYQSANESRAGS